MAGSNENRVGDVRPSILLGGFLKTAIQRADVGIGPTRRALSVINLNGGRYAPYEATKRDLRDKNAVCHTNVLQNSMVHRPLTRKFAAQLAAKQHQPLVEEIKQPVPSFPETMKINCSIIDVDEYKARDSFPEPVFDDDIEMADADMDIGAGEKKDPLVEYKDDLYVYYKNVEISFCAPPNYMTGQYDINERMRRILIDWLIEVHDKFNLRPETLYLTVNLIDRFLAVQPIMRQKFQLVGVTAMLIASKYEEISAPAVEDLILISDRAFTRNEVLQMEILMVSKLQFHLSIPTVYVFVKRFLEAGKSGNEMERLAFYMIDLCLVEYQMLKFPPSMLAAAAVFTAQCTLGKAAEWSRLSEKITDYKNHELKECSQLMAGFHRRAAAGKVTSVFRKYNSYKYGYAASAEPAHFLLDPSI
ncbi:hypothetical protein DCAR_0417056 [Daucus carota subsp. sativus]|uniref:Cyclin N-terminal domain-containing protein n=2 Tax=Daucus carota subsp. sativus TaxID=79200 RepID=A0AAF0WX35_DAUCS|nr:hypothetical protein DCAR_0417056 [Daucus carota subsp. sativus]